MVCQSHLEFMRWADEIYLRALSELPHGEANKDQGSSFQSMLGTLGHIYKGEVIWFKRVKLDPWAKLADIEVPEHIGMLEQVWAGLHDAWIEWAASVSAGEGWPEIVLHRNSQGTESKLPRWQIILHLVNHGSYHRGQIATMLRQSGITPPGTDLATFYRQRG